MVDVLREREDPKVAEGSGGDVGKECLGGRENGDSRCEGNARHVGCLSWNRWDVARFGLCSMRGCGISMPHVSFSYEGNAEMEPPGRVVERRRRTSNERCETGQWTVDRKEDSTEGPSL